MVAVTLERRRVEIGRNFSPKKQGRSNRITEGITVTEALTLNVFCCIEW